MEKTKTTRKTKSAEQKNLTISVFDLKGKEAKTIELSQDIFGVENNPRLMSQYIRVYLQNQRQGSAATKTRSEVIGSTKKIYRQKGTGNARHGSKKAPIFVGGGITFGPQPRDYSLSMNKKQKRKALFMSLSTKAHEQAIIGMSNDVLEMKAKTKDVVNFLTTSKLQDTKTLIVVPEVKKNGFMLSVRNIPFVEVVQATNINPYMILNNTKIIFVEEALSVMEKHFITNNEN